MKLYRVLDNLNNAGYARIAGLVSRIIRVSLACDIAVGARLAKGVVLKHNGLGVVIHPAAVLKEGVVVYQNVTIGGRGEQGPGAPQIGENTIIGCGAAVLGPIQIGNNVKIGANAVVLNSLPDNCTAVGIPAKIVGV